MKRSVLEAVPHFEKYEYFSIDEYVRGRPGHNNRKIKCERCAKLLHDAVKGGE